VSANQLAKAQDRLRYSEAFLTRWEPKQPTNFFFEEFKQNDLHGIKKTPSKKQTRVNFGGIF
jgi:hypothetical protein